MGYAGNEEPQFVIPTAIATGTDYADQRTAGGAGRRPSAAPKGGASSGASYDFVIGEEALAVGSRTTSAAIHYPIRHGQVEDWDLMESYWQHCFFRHLRCDPEEHAVLLTEPPMNAPENREYTAEVMFESFNVPHLYIAVQAVLALAASWLGSSGAGRALSQRPLTGTVVDSGDGVTHVIPVVEGYAIGSAIKHVPIAGREVTMFIQQLLRDRSADTPLLSAVVGVDMLDLARSVKVNSCYVCPDIAKEFARFDEAPSRLTQSIHIPPSALRGRAGDAASSFEVGIERFLAPEIFFSPEIAGGAFTTPLPTLVDAVVQSCPIDCRRDLYSNIVLSGGSTMFKGFGKRMQRDIRALVEERLAYTADIAAEAIVNSSVGLLSPRADGGASTAPQVNVVAHANQRYAVWAGGSLFASMEQFPSFCHSKAEYDECGPSICRQSRVFNSLLC